MGVWGLGFRVESLGFTETGVFVLFVLTFGLGGGPGYLGYNRGTPLRGYNHLGFEVTVCGFGCSGGFEFRGWRVSPSTNRSQLSGFKALRFRG